MLRILLYCVNLQNDIKKLYLYLDMGDLLIDVLILMMMMMMCTEEKKFVDFLFLSWEEFYENEVKLCI